jgi:hypothetical protein
MKMSKENAIRFMMLIERDEEVKSKYDNIMGKLESKNLSHGDWDNVINEELIPFAKELGYEFSPEDMKELEKPADGTLSDEELERVVGGRAQFSCTDTYKNLNGNTVTRTVHRSCEIIRSDSVFKFEYFRHPHDCVNIAWRGTDSSLSGCEGCVHYSSSVTTSESYKDQYKLL